MTDCKLLELAAKAAGLQVKGWVNDRLSYYDPVTGYFGHGDWNPLDDDGDAFRLAVSLKLNIQHTESTSIVRYRPFSHEWVGEVVNENNDKYAAARRAIVRAAAEIGRAI